MTTISPLLQSKINANNNKQTPNNRHEKVYQDLQKRAHEAKPNEAKAKMVKEGILGNPITATKDTFKDGKNFFIAAKTGNLGDNNLGRINDLGLKVGAGLIATFLALHSKTKTESIMKFIGGATFIAMMDLWPKLFINLPARLVHGFRIDRKYISAQGDKKDFFLDNQFLVWDAYPEEQLRKDAKNAGIDYDSENGKEKIQRKMQKTALQNRTLWMATAGFATPLLTAMTGNFIQPLVKEAVIKHDVKKAEKVLTTENGLKNYLDGLSESAKVSKDELKALDSILDAYQSGKMSYEDMISALSDKFSLARLFETLKDSDDANPLKSYRPANLAATLKQMYESCKESLNSTNIIKAINTNLASLGQAPLEEADALAILKELGDDYSKENIKRILGSFLNPEDYEGVFDALKVDKEKFAKQIREYYSGPFAQLKARVKGYLDLINPLIGSKDESLQTLEFNKTMKSIFKILGVDADEIKEITKTLRDDNGNASDVTKKVFKLLSGKIVSLDEAKRSELLELLSSKDFGDKTTTLIEELLKGGNLIQGDDVSPLTKAILGIAEDTQGRPDIGNKDGVISVIKKFIGYKDADIKAIKSKLIIIDNLEKRIKAGEFSDEEIKIARRYAYDGSISTIIAPVRRDTADNFKFKEALKKVFNPDEFEDTNIKKIVKDIIAIGTSDKSNVSPTVDYMSCGSFTQHIKNFAANLSNNKAWMKKFAPMTIALIAVTLLAQPFFGKINKEFPEEGKNGGAK